MLLKDSCLTFCTSYCNIKIEKKYIGPRLTRKKWLRFMIWVPYCNIYVQDNIYQFYILFPSHSCNQIWSLDSSGKLSSKSFFQFQTSTPNHQFPFLRNLYGLKLPPTKRLVFHFDNILSQFIRYITLLSSLIFIFYACIVKIQILTFPLESGTI